MLLTALVLSLFTCSVQLERPHLTVAQGYIESNMKRKAVGKAGEKGAWQVMEKHWGKVPKSLVGQAKQAESILDALLLENNNCLYTALCRYNGAGSASRRYASKVRKKAFELAVMTI